MAFSNTTGNVKGPLISAIALCAPAADFSAGVEIGMKKPSKLMVAPIETGMSSGNAWVDAMKVSIETAGLQNDFATLATVNGLAEGYTQACLKTAGGAWLSFLGADSDSETLMGLEWEWSFKANEDEIKYKIGTEVARDTYNTLFVESVPASDWASGVDTTKRMRPGIQKVTFGGAHLGALVSVEGSVKSKSVMVQLGRALSVGVEAAIKIVMAQTAKAEITAALAAAAGSDTVIVYFWDGVRTLKLTNLLAGKACTFENGEKETVSIEVKAFFPKGSSRIIINTTPGVFELVFLDNVAEV